MGREREREDIEGREEKEDIDRWGNSQREGDIKEVEEREIKGEEKVTGKCESM